MVVGVAWLWGTSGLCRGVVVMHVMWGASLVLLVIGSLLPRHVMGGGRHPSLTALITANTTVHW